MGVGKYLCGVSDGALLGCVLAWSQKFVMANCFCVFRIDGTVPAQRLFGCPIFQHPLPPKAGEGSNERSKFGGGPAFCSDFQMQSPLTDIAPLVRPPPWRCAWGRLTSTPHFMGTDPRPIHCQGYLRHPKQMHMFDVTANNCADAPRLLHVMSQHSEHLIAEDTGLQKRSSILRGKDNV